MTSASWKVLFPETRLHMWDTTDIQISKPSDRDLQRATYNSYYGGNVAKGGVGMTAFGWLMEGPLVAGSASDSTYLDLSGIYGQQQALTSLGGPSCTNYTDKGFTDGARAYCRYGQKLLTPCFLTRSRFTPIEVLMTSDRANKRARNERAVRYPKLLMSSIDSSTAPSVSSLQWQNTVFRANFLFSMLTPAETKDLPALAMSHKLIRETIGQIMVVSGK